MSPRHLTALAAVAICIAWLIWSLYPARVRVVGRAIIHKERGKKESMALDEIVKVDYHYHAAVGFVAVWEFTSASGATLDVDHQALGLRQVLASLERELPGFSLAPFQRLFDEGDIVDSIRIWQRA